MLDILMELKFLEEIGLTKNESKVYITLLKIGTSRTGDILKKSNLNSGKIYEILDSLAQKGLVKESIINKIKYFTAISPERIIDYLDNKEKKIKENKELVLDKLIPQLNNLVSENDNVKAVTFVGIEGMKSVILEILPLTTSEDEILTMGVTGFKDERINQIWKNFFSPKRIENKIKLKTLFNHEKNEYINT